MEPKLPDGAKSIVWIERDGVKFGLCDIHGFCWLHGLESDGNDPYAFFKNGRFKELEDIARREGYASILAESSNERVIEAALRMGWQNKVIERKL